jgi:hypothetical protein
MGCCFEFFITWSLIFIALHVSSQRAKVELHLPVKVLCGFPVTDQVEGARRGGVVLMN